MAALVVVLGSANLDQMLVLDRFPRPGETLLAASSARHVGGKGLNQATSSARAGSPTSFIGAVGDDSFGDQLADWLRAEHVDTALLRRMPTASGTAVVLVDGRGENSIVVAAGANATLETLTGADEEMIRSAAVLALQCEVPASVLSAAAQAASATATRVILNAAPVVELPDALIAHVDVLVVNEHEARALGASGPRQDLARGLAGRVADAIVTLGAEGAVWAGRSGAGRCRAPVVPSVDTTGAGDTFVGYLAAGLSTGMEWPGAIRRAVTAAALAVQRPGGAPAVPTAREVDDSFTMPTF
jgi:ribokinase